MANLFRSAKSGNVWTEHELRAYHIRVEWHDAHDFFQIPTTLPAPVLQNPDILEILDPIVNLPYPVFEFLRLMDEVMDPVDGEQSAVVDFAVVLLQELGYTSVGTKTPRNLRRRKEIPFLICGETRHTQADVCVLDYTNSITSISLVVHADKRNCAYGRDPMPELVAMAIAAFHSNNLTRQRMGLPPLASKVIGTSPIFYKIPVTQELVSAVMSGSYPATETIVEVHLPVIPRPNRRSEEGMKPLDNRLAILSCYEALKQFL
ncbi:hypothetical protein MSAN_02236400 [Mycena sanguinolenta]|uniref:Uncharacterized protein n=1 Tax=Mycena sanguinolenta TaxID=230812 RepID=A0A8H7CIK6_9AGAR|nr:hypothetical protein MSAN_02236400 [Mycena sanguinolenta]